MCPSVHLSNHLCRYLSETYLVLFYTRQCDTNWGHDMSKKEIDLYPKKPIVWSENNSHQMIQHKYSRYKISWIQYKRSPNTFSLNRFVRLWLGLLMMHWSSLLTCTLAFQPATCFNPPHPLHQCSDSQGEQEGLQHSAGTKHWPPFAVASAMTLMLSKCLVPP